MNNIGSHKTKDFSPQKKLSGFKEVASYQKNNKRVTKYQDQSEKEVWSSDSSGKPSPQKKKRRLASSEEWSDGETQKFSGKKSVSSHKSGFKTSKQNGKRLTKSKQKPSICSESSDSEPNNNSDYEKKLNEDAEDSISAERIKVSCNGTDHDRKSTSEKSNKGTHTKSKLSKRNRNICSDSSDEESPVLSLKDESDQEEAVENSDFKLSLEKDSRSDDNTDFSEEIDESLKSVSSKHKSRKMQESDAASDLSEENENKLKENLTKKRIVSKNNCFLDYIILSF